MTLVNRKSHCKRMSLGFQSKSNPPRIFFLPDPQQKNWETTPWRFHCFFFTKIFVVLGNTLFLFLPILVVLLIPKRLKELENKIIKAFLGGGFKHFLCSPQFGEDSHFDSYFSDGLVQPPTRFSWDLSATCQALLLERLLQADVGVKNDWKISY